VSLPQADGGSARGAVNDENGGMEDVDGEVRRAAPSTSFVPRRVMILNDVTLQTTRPDDAERGAFVHIDDVTSAVLLSLQAPVDGHHQLALCGPSPSDTTAAVNFLRWNTNRGWPEPT
jgi:hypothetical protein